MANYREDFANINLETGTISRNFMNHSIGGGDALGDRFGVRVFRNGEAVTLGGTCAGYFVRNTTGETVVITGGVVSGNEAYVTLPAACYAVEGSFTIAIKVTVDSEIVTLRIVDGVVDRTNTSVVVDPGDILPSIEDLLQAIEDAVESIPADYSSLWTSLAPAFSSSTAYKAGQYVTYDGKFWRFTTDHAAGAWNAAHATQVNVGGDMSDQKSAIDDMELTSLSACFEVGGSPNEAGTEMIGVSTSASIVIPVKSGDALSIVGVSAFSIIVFAKSYSGSTIVPSSVTGYTSTKYISTSGRNFTVPSDVNYLIISKYTYASGVTTNRLPTKFVMNGYDYAKQANRNIFDIINQINEKKGKAEADEEIGNITDFLGTSTFEIAKAYVDSSNGKITSINDYKLICFKVTPESYVTATGTYDRYAFFVNKPAMGSVSNDNTAHASSSIVNLSVPSGCNWVAIRTGTSGSVSIKPSNRLILNGNVTITADNKANYFTDCDNAPDNSIFTIQRGAEIEHTPYGSNISTEIDIYDGTVRSMTGYADGVLYTFAVGNSRQQFFLTNRNNTRSDIILFFRSKMGFSTSWMDWRCASSTVNLTTSNIAIRKKMVAPYLDGEGHPTTEDTGVPNPQYMGDDPLIFTDFDDAPINSIYQIDLDCDEGTLAHNPAPGKSSMLITMNCLYLTHHGEAQFCVGLKGYLGKTFCYWRYGYQQSENNYVFTPWQKMMDDDDIASYIKNMGKLTSGSDLNSITGNCVYLCGDNEGNEHMPQNVDGFLTTKTVGTIRYQTFEVLLSAVRYTRYASGDTWSNWVSN